MRRLGQRPSVDDGSLALGGTTDDGRASYQVALDVCEDCRRVRQAADGELIDVAPAVAAMAACDAQHLPSAHTGDPVDARRQLR